MAEWRQGSVDVKSLRVFAHGDITSQRPAQGDDVREFTYEGKPYSRSAKGTFKTDARWTATDLARAKRMIFVGETLRYVRFLNDFCVEDSRIPTCGLIRLRRDLMTPKFMSCRRTVRLSSVAFS